MFYDQVNTRVSCSTRNLQSSDSWSMSQMCRVKCVFQWILTRRKGIFFTQHIEWVQVCNFTSKHATLTLSLYFSVYLFTCSCQLESQWTPNQGHYTENSFFSLCLSALAVPASLWSRWWWSLHSLLNETTQETREHNLNQSSSGAQVYCQLVNLAESRWKRTHQQEHLNTAWTREKADSRAESGRAFTWIVAKWTLLQTHKTHIETHNTHFILVSFMSVSFCWRRREEQVRFSLTQDNK